MPEPMLHTDLFGFVHKVILHVGRKGNGKWHIKWPPARNESMCGMVGLVTAELKTYPEQEPTCTICQKLFEESFELASQSNKQVHYNHLETKTNAGTK